MRNFSCSYIYNYNQTECLEEMPEGYYLNDSILKTIDNCHPDCRTCDNKETFNNSNCISCFPDKYLYYGNCTNECPNNFYTEPQDNLSKICKCVNNNCLSCPLENINICYSCNEGYYPIYNDTSNIYPYINCYKSPEGFYLDNKDKYYKSCYLSCKSCTEKGDIKYNNCLECALNYQTKNDSPIDRNCYEICENYYYYDNEKIHHCVNECPDIFNKLIEEKKKCVDDCSKDDTYKYKFRKKCFKECPNNSKPNKYYCEIECPESLPYEILKTQELVKNCSSSEIIENICILNNKNTEKNEELQQELVNNIQENIMSGEMDISNITSGEDIVREEKGISFTVTTTENQKTNENNNVTTINLGGCENKIKEHYKIPKNETLYIFKIDAIQEGMKIPKIEYEVYYPLNGDKLQKLNLSVCEDSKVELSIPVSIDESNLDKHNLSSSYYSDICYISTSERGTDLTLDDRKAEFISNNYTLC